MVRGNKENWQAGNPSMPSATETLLASVSPISIYALNLRNAVMGIHEHWTFFTQLLPDSVGDEVYDKQVHQALQTIGSALLNIAAAAAHPELGVSLSDFRKHYDDRHVAENVKNLQNVVNCLAKIDAWYADLDANSRLGSKGQAN